MVPKERVGRLWGKGPLTAAPPPTDASAPDLLTFAFLFQVSREVAPALAQFSGTQLSVWFCGTWHTVDRRSGTSTPRGIPHKGRVVGGNVFLCFGRGLYFNRADPQPSSTVASLSCARGSRGIISFLGVSACGSPCSLGEPWLLSLSQV